MEMTKKWMALSLMLVAPAVFGQPVMTAPHPKKKAEAAPNPNAAPVKTLRDEIKRDKDDLTAKVKKERAERKELLVQEKAELAKAGKSEGTRAEKKAARLAVRQKYAQMFKDAHQKDSYERKNLREDIVSKRAQIQKLRQS
jgi:flagellar biosynthesis/type III secretory pathway protein FliH